MHFVIKLTPHWLVFMHISSAAFLDLNVQVNKTKQSSGFKQNVNFSKKLSFGDMFMKSM